MNCSDMIRGDKMANEQNLKMYKPGEKRARENGKKGNIASQEAKRRKKDLKACIEALLEHEIEDKKGNKMSGAEAISIKQFEKALKGDAKAFELLRDTSGQKPIEKIQVAEVDADTIKHIEDLVNDDED